MSIRGGGKEGIFLKISVYFLENEGFSLFFFGGKNEFSRVFDDILPKIFVLFEKRSFQKASFFL